MPVSLQHVQLKIRLIVHLLKLWLFKGNAAFNGGRIGAKASRVIRMIPLVRLVKLGKVTFQRSRGKDLPVMGIINTRFARFVPT